MKGILITSERDYSRDDSRSRPVNAVASVAFGEVHDRRAERRQNLDRWKDVLCLNHDFIPVEPNPPTPRRVVLSSSASTHSTGS